MACVREMLGDADREGGSGGGGPRQLSVSDRPSLGLDHKPPSSPHAKSLSWRRMAAGDILFSKSN